MIQDCWIAFLVGGLLCAIGQVLIDYTKLTPARILTGYVVAGVLLSAVGLYPKLIDWAGGGASVPLTGFGNLLAQGVRDAIREDGFLGVFTGGLQAAAGGLSAALGFGLLAAICFHPKDKYGQFVQPFDYRYSGGQGARGAYAENNGWIYRWDVPHNVGDLIQMMGGNDAFVSEMERMYSTPLGRSKYDFFAQIPDHTGNVGQFSMANEPCLHIPYLYNYAGQPWRTQKRIRTLLTQWFRNDLMGVPGDEDGGGLSAFVVFSSMGFYPVTPGIPVYNIGSPLFQSIKIDLKNGKTFEIEALNNSEENKYIQSATLNGKKWNKPWFSHDEIKNGGKLILIMGNRANPEWGSSPESVPPSGE